jgi:hypothetical protein
VASTKKDQISAAQLARILDERPPQYAALVADRRIARPIAADARVFSARRRVHLRVVRFRDRSASPDLSVVAGA